MQSLSVEFYEQKEMKCHVGVTLDVKSLTVLGAVVAFVLFRLLVPGLAGCAISPELPGGVSVAKRLVVMPFRTFSITSMSISSSGSLAGSSGGWDMFKRRVFVTERRKRNVVNAIVRSNESFFFSLWLPRRRSVVAELVSLGLKERQGV